MTASFAQLLSPIKIAGMTLPNRMVMGAMHTRLETLDRPIERLSAFYARRAEGEIALILTGGYAPVPEGVMEDVAPLLNSSSQLQEDREIAAAVHRAGGDEDQVGAVLWHAQDSTPWPPRAAPPARQGGVAISS